MHKEVHELYALPFAESKLFVTDGIRGTGIVPTINSLIYNFVLIRQAAEPTQMLTNLSRHFCEAQPSYYVNVTNRTES